MGVNKGHGLINALLVTYLRRKLCLQTLTVRLASGTPQHECLKRPSRQKLIRDTPPARPAAALGEEGKKKKESADLISLHVYLCFIATCPSLASAPPHPLPFSQEAERG